ncbi:VOC family protein [Pseudoalteromonas sp. SS15]|uniref:VOC family protein n=1 Tax=Pseudoalteromonas sp. SS15 TaxID=3139393 RepID=UPI003BAC3434
MNSPLTLLVVKNIAESLHFYIETLGLKLLEQYDDCIKLKSGAHEIIMFEGTNKATEYAHGYNANSTLLFTVDDLDSRIKEMKSFGVQFVHDSPNENRWGRYSAFKDPSGIVHELFQLHV